jgi:hypothetical protein
MIINTRFPLTTSQYEQAQKKNTEKLKDVMSKLAVSEKERKPEFSNMTGKGNPFGTRELPVIYTNTRAKKPKTFKL